MGTIVLHFPPTISIHITKEVTIVPPLKTASRTLERINAQYQGTNEAMSPNTDWRSMQMIKIGFLPTLSARTPNRMLPTINIFSSHKIQKNQQV